MILAPRPLALLLVWGCASAASSGTDVQPPAEAPAIPAGSCYVDADGDGYAGTRVEAGTDGCGDLATASTDCDDADASTWPGAPDGCDGRDHGCDGVASTDDDGDGWPNCGRVRPVEAWYRLGIGQTGSLGERLGERIAWADVSGDGIPDLILSAPYANGTSASAGRVEVRTLHPGPDGSWTDELIWAVQSNQFNDQMGFEWALVKDLDGDRLPELAIAVPRDGIGASSEITIYRSPLRGVAQVLDVTASLDEVPARRLWSGGDLNHDGFGDLIALRERAWPAPPVLQWVPGRGGGMAWDAAVDLPPVDLLPDDHDAVLTADVTGDGWEDLILGASHPSGISLWAGGPSGPSAPTVLTCPGAPAVTTCGHALALHDVNGDGAADLLATAGTAPRFGSHGGYGGIAILPGGPAGVLQGGAQTGTFVPNDDAAVGVDEGSVAAIHDLDGDGIPELVATGDDATGSQRRGDVRLWHSVPAGGWTARPLILEPPPVAGVAAPFDPSSLLSIGDIDGDGLGDLLVSDASWRPTPYSAYFGRVAIWRGTSFGDPDPADPAVP